MTTTCPKCNQPIELNIGRLLGQRTSRRKAAAARRNGRLGGATKFLLTRNEKPIHSRAN